MIDRGVIISVMGDCYKVASHGKEFICRPRGAFRIKDISPCCGDNVVFDILDDGSGVINQVLERKNEIIRPPLANLDQIVFVISTCEPSPNILLLDKFLAVASYKGIDPIIVFTKTDKQSADRYLSIYSKIYPTFSVDNVSGDGCLEVKSALKDKLSAFTGNSGSGKSSLLNNICPDLMVKTDEISRKLGRGKHTTRRVDIYQLDCGGYVADTPGFSTFDTSRYEVIMKEDLADCFPEFSQYTEMCRFQNCSHTKEQGCGVRSAVEDGQIALSRHQSYVSMYSEAAKIKPWEHKA